MDGKNLPAQGLGHLMFRIHSHGLDDNHNLLILIQNLHLTALPTFFFIIPQLRANSNLAVFDFRCIIELEMEELL
jgi:hypothetical protein